MTEEQQKSLEMMENQFARPTFMFDWQVDEEPTPLERNEALLISDIINLVANHNGVSNEFKKSILQSLESIN
jgi:hypothetical protein